MFAPINISWLYDGLRPELYCNCSHVIYRHHINDSGCGDCKCKQDRFAIAFQYINRLENLIKYILIIDDKYWYNRAKKAEKQQEEHICNQ